MLRILKSLWRISEEKVSFKVYVIINWLKDGLNIDLFTLSELKNVKVIFHQINISIDRSIIHKPIRGRFGTRI